MWKKIGWVASSPAQNFFMDFCLIPRFKLECKETLMGRTRGIFPILSRKAAHQIKTVGLLWRAGILYIVKMHTSRLCLSFSFAKVLKMKCHAMGVCIFIYPPSLHFDAPGKISLYNKKPFSHIDIPKRKISIFS